LGRSVDRRLPIKQYRNCWPFYEETLDAEANYALHRSETKSQEGETAGSAFIEKGRQSDWIGSMKSTFEILGDIISPASDEDDWEVLRD
jgi:hypothetical protein